MTLSGLAVSRAIYKTAIYHDSCPVFSIDIPDGLLLERQAAGGKMASDRVRGRIGGPACGQSVEKEKSSP